MKKVLVIGGTGAMGTYLVPELVELGYQVDVVAADKPVSTNERLTYIQTNGLDLSIMSEIVKKGYDAIVDFMIYPVREMYEPFVTMYLANTGHYFYLSTYRVYANEEHPVKETSPRLLDVSKDQTLLTSGDYSIYKAEGEEFIKSLGKKNWTILRPAITYSKRRFQLVTLEMDVVIRRMLEKKPLLLPKEAMNIEATMSWGGDVGRMIARLVFNPAAYGEAFSVCTAEHHTWEEIAKMYQRIGGLEYITVDTKTYLDMIGGSRIHAKQQLVYDRLYDRIMDNTKILNATGMKQSELMPLEKGLAREISGLPKNMQWTNEYYQSIYNNMDEYLRRI